MRLELSGRHVEITPAIRALVDRKLARLTRNFNDAVVSVQVVVTREKYRHLTDLTVHMRGDHVLAGKTSGVSWNDSLGRAVEKVEQQAAKVKGKWTSRKRPARVPRPAPEAARVAGDDGEPPRVVRASRYHVKPLSVEAAAMAVETGTDGFLVFRNAGTGAINVLYRRKSGDLGLIEPER
jgi:ribosome hibernation promoting factor